MASQDSQPFHWHYTEFDDRNFQIRGRTLFSIAVLLSIFLLVILLFLYTRWICRFHQRPSSLNPPGVTPQPQHRGLDATTINELPIFLHRSSSSITATSAEETECSICLGIFQEGDKVKVLPVCRHCYHSECVDRWLTTQSNCPLCRASVRVASASNSAVPPTVIQ